MGDFDLDCKKVRNICILAHVDHGKTTLADHLIAGCNGAVHPKQAGKLRFMDYLDEEQRRAITMKSSSIGLKFKDYDINLIDSPGHMDFCSEVSTAARLSDGALVLVDSVEGVHIQTHAVLRQAWVEKLTPCLVLNKIDRLIYELKLTPMEAYNRLLRIVHEVNNIVSGYKSEKYLSDVDSILAGPSGVDLGDDENPEFFEDDEEDTFQPQKGNVAFVCALDGWGFCVGEFAEFYAKKFGGNVTSFKKAFWGPRYFNSKTKMIVSKKAMGGGSNIRPMFVQFVLEPLWQVYQGALEPDGGKAMLEKVIKNFNLSVLPRELQHKDPKTALQAVFSRWLPLSNTILSMVVRCMPDPIDAQSFRISRLLPKREVVDQMAGSEVFARPEHVRRCVETCDSSPEALTVAFVSKIFAVPLNLIPARGPNDEIIDTSSEEESDECFLAFARIFSGVLTMGQKINVLSALYDPLNVETTQKHLQEAEVRSLYLMMGQGLKPVASVKTGNVVAIRGLGHHILKSATLSSTKDCWPFSSLMFQVSPMLKVAIEPSDPADMGALLKGLKLLNRADPFVEVTVSSRGEHILAAAGEVHIERCIKDLREIFAKVSLELSGFQIATSAGPLCDEPMWGLAFIVEAHIRPSEVQSNELENPQQSLDQYGMFTGQVMTVVKEACRAAVLQKRPRLVEAMYFCELNTPAEYLGTMYGVLGRRRVRVVKEEMQESSPLFTVHAYLPVSESFGFADELRNKTSGSSSALLVLSHWEALMEDPFFVPKTEEEIEEFGDGSSVPQNTARKLIDAVRRRKGLPVEEKVVQHATKQRTLARKV
ncbi:LOW QUALITY PROTEIN: uncharacterized protein LOC141615378 [Silene latifolia]|uniref:LOW QUALITY PROTEIN: uncharacterized protein LOC141615378 n=1 Tax=Silene latifolia TaxID=37657 RepID=UPI003D774F8E